ncbi:MAG: trigger factor [Oceanococcaceae bacterium]
MQVSVEALEGLSRKMRVAVPSADFQEAYRSSVQRLAKTVQLKGFRRGKVPVRIVEQQYGAQARQDALTKVLEGTYPQALQQTDMKPAGQPDISVESLEGEEIVYTATFDIFPDIVLTGLDGLKVELAQTEITDADVQQVIDRLREQRKTWSDRDGACAEGDKVTIDFVGRIDGEEFAGGSGSDTELELGAGRFLKALEDGIVGMTAGDEKVVPVTFPDDYHNDELQGKTAEFTVNLKSAQVAQVPDIDADFLESFGVTEGGEDALRSQVQANLEKEKTKLVKQWRKSQILEGVLAANPIDVPAGIVAEEVVRLRQETAQNMGMGGRGLSAEQIEQMIPANVLEPQAKRRAALGLLLGEIIKTQQIKVDDARVEARLQEIAGDYEQTDEALSYYRSNAQFMQGLRAVVLEDQVVDDLAARAVTSEVSLSFEELSQKVRN